MRPTTDPSITPLFTGSILERECLILTVWLLFDKILVNQDNTEWRIPSEWRRSRSTWFCCVKYFSWNVVSIIIFLERCRNNKAFRWHRGDRHYNIGLFKNQYSCPVHALKPLLIKLPPQCKLYIVCILQRNANWESQEIWFRCSFSSSLLCLIFCYCNCTKHTCIYWQLHVEWDKNY